MFRGVVAGNQQVIDMSMARLTIITFSMTPMIRTHICKIHILVILWRK